jgi:hypothetical protein
MSQNIDKSIRIITQKAHGTYNGAIIDMMVEVSNVLTRFNHRLTKLENAQCPPDDCRIDAPVLVPSLQDGLQDGTAGEEMPESGLSKPEGRATEKANKATTGKAKKTPKRSL